LATINSTQAGNWTTGATWVGGVAPGAPDIGACKHAVIVNQAITILGFQIDGGSLAINHDITFSDAAGAGFSIKATTLGAITSNGTAAAPRQLKSASTSPTNPWTITYYCQATIPDDRSIDFSFCEFIGNLWYLGNSSNYINFNASGTTSPFITITPPFGRAPILDNIKIEGRMRSRIYQSGCWAGALPVTGRAPWSSYMWQTLLDLMESKERFAFFSKYVHIPHCRFEQEPRFKPQAGSLYFGFDLALIEDA